MAKNFYITSSIVYANASPHIGYAMELIQADTLARYRRQLGDSVFFATGMDEHGVKIARKAEELGKTPQQLVDENAEKARALKDVLNLSWDVFVRTTDRENHWPAAEAMWNALYKKGDLYRKVYEGMYCVGHEAFVTEKDLRDGLCIIHKTKPEVLKEENWFFRLSKYSQAIQKALDKGTVAIIPDSRKNEIRSFIKEGIDDVSFSRPRKDLSWGIPVPNDPTQTMYVWTDALTNYLSALTWEKKTKFSLRAPALKKWWPADAHMIGKDIIRFHALIWLGMLMSAGLRLPKTIFVHGFITVGGEKMSKSIGNVVDPHVLSQKYGADALRYYLMREIPSGEDGDFTIEKFEARYNGDLANGLGNLVARVAAIGEKISPFPFSPTKSSSGIKKEVKNIEKKYRQHMEYASFHEALADIWHLIGVADRFINEKKPWAIKDEKDLKKVIGDAAYLIYWIAIFLVPFLPKTADAIISQFLWKNGKLNIKKSANLFPRLM